MLWINCLAQCSSTKMYDEISASLTNKTFPVIWPVYKLKFQIVKLQEMWPWKFHLEVVVFCLEGANGSMFKRNKFKSRYDFVTHNSEIQLLTSFEYYFVLKVFDLKIRYLNRLSIRKNHFSRQHDSWNVDFKYQNEIVTPYESQK